MYYFAEAPPDSLFSISAVSGILAAICCPSTWLYQLSHTPASLCPWRSPLTSHATHSAMRTQGAPTTAWRSLLSSPHSARKSAQNYARFCSPFEVNIQLKSKPGNALTFCFPKQVYHVHPQLAFSADAIWLHRRHAPADKKEMARRVPVAADVYRQFGPIWSNK